MNCPKKIVWYRIITVIAIMTVISTGNSSGLQKILRWMQAFGKEPQSRSAKFGDFEHDTETIKN
jgi:hypothetical protein